MPATLTDRRRSAQSGGYGAKPSADDEGTRRMRKTCHAFRSGRPRSCLSRWPTRAASRTARSAPIWRWPPPARGSRAWKQALGVALLKRGRRGVELTAAGESLLDHARIVMHNVEAMRGDLARLRQRRPRPASICSPTPRACRSICRRRWRHSCANIPISTSTSRSAKAPISPRRSRPAPPISALPPSMRCPNMSSGFCSARTA